MVFRLLEENAAPREEVARLKGLKGRPKIKPSGMEGASARRRRGQGGKPGRRGGKPARLVIDEQRLVAARVPAGSRFKGYEDYVVQDLILRPQVVRHRRERWLTPDGRTVVTPLPEGVSGHFGAALRRYVLSQYHQGQVTTPRLVAQLNDIGVAISKRQVVRLGRNGVCTRIGNHRFAWFATTRSKSRLNFLALLRAGHQDFVINPAALTYTKGG